MATAEPHPHTHTHTHTLTHTLTLTLNLTLTLTLTFTRDPQPATRTLSRYDANSRFEAAKAQREQHRAAEQEAERQLGGLEGRHVQISER